MELAELFSDYTFRTVFLGTTAIGAVSGGLGCYAYLRKQSLVGDVVAHSTLFGVLVFFVGCYLITGTGSKDMRILIAGAFSSGFAALWLTNWLLQHTRVREDSALGVMLAIFFGSGLFLLRWIQAAQPPIPQRGGLQNYIFGMAASMTSHDLATIVFLGLAALLVTIFAWKELKVFTLDPLFTYSLGFRRRRLETIMTGILVVAIVIGIQSIGVILMIAMLITPAAAARQWTSTLHSMMLLAALFGGLSAATGTLMSATLGSLPTGPVIVLTCVSIFLFSILFSPKRGVFSGKAGLNKSLIIK